MAFLSYLFRTLYSSIEFDEYRQNCRFYIISSCILWLRTNVHIQQVNIGFVFLFKLCHRQESNLCQTLTSPVCLCHSYTITTRLLGDHDDLFSFDYLFCQSISFVCLCQRHIIYIIIYIYIVLEFRSFTQFESMLEQGSEPTSIFMDQNIHTFH